MTMKVICACDFCGTDLSVSKSFMDYRTVIYTEVIPGSQSEALLVYKESPVFGPMHFCNNGCMRKYLDQKWKEQDEQNAMNI